MNMKYAFAGAAVAVAMSGMSLRGAPVDDMVSLAGRWGFALGDAAACTDTITLPSTTDMAKKGDERSPGVPCPSPLASGLP